MHFHWEKFDLGDNNKQAPFLCTSLRGSAEQQSSSEEVSAGDGHGSVPVLAFARRQSERTELSWKLL